GHGGRNVAPTPEKNMKVILVLFTLGSFVSSTFAAIEPCRQMHSIENAQLAMDEHSHRSSKKDYAALTAAATKLAKLAKRHACGTNLLGSSPLAVEIEYPADT